MLDTCQQLGLPGLHSRAHAGEDVALVVHLPLPLQVAELDPVVETLDLAILQARPGAVCHQAWPVTAWQAFGLAFM